MTKPMKRQLFWAALGFINVVVFFLLGHKTGETGYYLASIMWMWLAGPNLASFLHERREYKNYLIRKQELLDQG